MQFENPMTFVRAIKGAPASILWALMITRSMMTALELQQWTGYQGDAITVAVRLLVSLGWVVARTPRGPWALAEGRQLPLMSGIEQLVDQENFSQGKVDSFTRTDSVLNGVSDHVVVNADTRNVSPTITTTTTTTRGANPFKTDSWSDVQRAAYQALKDAGVKGKKSRALVELPWVTAEYVRAHAALVQSEQWDNPAGMMVYRMEGEEPAPEVKGKTASFHVRTIDRGKRGVERVSYTWDIDQEIADFIGHEKGCRCSKCLFMLTVNMDKSAVCPVCKYRECECEESEEEE